MESDAEKKSRPLLTNSIGENYFNTLGLTLLHGRDFGAPAEDLNHVIINETAVRELGFASPEAALGERLVLPGISDGVYRETRMEYEITGIIKDFNLNLKQPQRGEIFYNHYFHLNFNEAIESPAEFFLVKLSTKNLRYTMTNIEKAWKQLFPQTPFDYFFLDTYFDSFYKEEKQFAGVFAFFAVIGILITCMGLFGLSLFDTNSRTKEIGIRKSLGASVRSIMWLFSRDYMKLVLVAGIIAIPVGIYILLKWLNNYPQRILLTADAVLLPLILMCCIALFTVGYHTYKTACIDPVKSLRAE